MLELRPISANDLINGSLFLLSFLSCLFSCWCLCLRSKASFTLFLISKDNIPELTIFSRTKSVVINQNVVFYKWIANDLIIKIKQTCNLFQTLSFEIKHNRSIKNTTSKLEKWMQWNSGDVWLWPTIPSFFNIFFKFDPSLKLNH